jgi:hypothetical protein
MNEANIRFTSGMPGLKLHDPRRAARSLNEFSG